MSKNMIFAVLLIALVVTGWFCKDQIFSNDIINEAYISINNPVRTLDPVNAFDDDSLSVIGQSLDTLYQYHYLKRPYEVIPSLADGMPNITDDGKTYLIKIKQGIFYHDKTPFFKKKRVVKAQDFITQIKRLAFLPLKSVGKWLFSGKIKGFDKFSEIVGSNFSKMLKTPIEGITALDDYTLKIELKNPEPNLLYFLSMTFTTPVPEELIIKYKNDLSKIIVGTGAYYLENMSKMEYIFVKNPNYRKELYPSSGDRYANTQNLLSSSKEKLPFIDKVYFKVISDEKKRWNAFMDGKLDVLSVPKSYLSEVSGLSQKFEKLKKEKGFEVKFFTTISSRWFGFNMQDPIIGKNKNLRYAIAHAINYDKYIELLTNNTSLKANSIFNPSIPGYNPSYQKKYSYNLDKARDYLKKSKIDLNKFVLTYSTRGTQQVHFNEAEFVKQQLAQIGIRVRVEVQSFSDFIKKGRAGKMQFFTDQWIYDYPDAENILQLLISKNAPGINKSQYKNSKIDKLYNKLEVTLNKEERFKIMYEIESIVEDELPWIMLMYESSYVLNTQHLENFRKSFFIRNYLKYLKKK